MKNAVRIYGVILFILSIFLIQSCEEKPTAPVITTTAVTAISYTTATSGGNVTNEGGAPVASRGVCWNTSADPTFANSKTIDGGSGPFTSNITNLTPNTMYYVRAYATNNAGTGYGNQVSFSTLQATAPVLTTAAITSITQTTAVSGGNITADNGSAITARGICWGTDVNPTISNNKTSDAAGTGIFTSTLTGLTGNTTYYVRAYATNSVDTEYGNQVSFKTSPLMPALSTTTISSITQTSAASGGNVTSDGGATVTARGICWSTSANPTIALSTKTTDGTGTGIFTSSITGLTHSTTYYVRAYATNSVGTEYGSTISFTTQIGILFNPNLTYGSLTDIDGNVYKTITIGSQTWMAENLKTTRYNDGTAIPLVTDGAAWEALSSPGYCWYNNDATNKATYGALYNGYTVRTGKLCPTGWHVPTDAEWTTLTTYAGGKSVAGGKLKETGTNHWGTITGATNETGFTALPGGGRGNIFGYIGILGGWWSSSEFSRYNVWSRYLIDGSSSVNRTDVVKTTGLSVRCMPGEIDLNLPVKTINYVDDGAGYLQYYTNDVANCSTYGGKSYFYINTTDYAPFHSVETEVIKNSGSSYMYGIVFCYSDANNYYRFLISTYGYYEIFRNVSGVYSWYNFNTNSWQGNNSFAYPMSTHLNDEYGDLNKIKVIATGGGNFDLYFNGTKEDSFTGTNFTSGKTGFASFLGTSSEENFPNTPVDIRFKEISANK